MNKPLMTFSPSKNQRISNGKTYGKRREKHYRQIHFFTSLRHCRRKIPMPATIISVLKSSLQNSSPSKISISRKTNRNDSMSMKTANIIANAHVVNVGINFISTICYSRLHRRRRKIKATKSIFYAVCITRHRHADKSV